MITSSQILFFTPYFVNKHYLWLQAHEFYNFNLMFITTPFNFFVCGFRCYYVLSNFIFISFPAWNIFSLFLLLFLQTFQDFSSVFDFTLIDSKTYEFLHYYFCALCNMVHFMLLDAWTSPSW